MADDHISRQAAIDALNEIVKDHSITDFDAIASILDLPPAQPTQLTDDDIETIRIHLSAFKEKLCNQHRWNEAKEYEALIDRLTVQPEPCEDAVSRKDCLKALSNMMDTDGFRNGWAVSRANVECMLKAMPPVTPKQRKEILYRHYKGGTYELVCNNVTHTETGEALVVYRDCQGQLWARPESMFYGLVKVGDDLVPRFVLCRSEGDTE